MAADGHPLAALHELVTKHGLHQGEVMQYFGNTDHPAIVLARELDIINDELEIDDVPMLSEADDGCWVSAWIWIPNPDPEVEWK